MAGLGLSCLQGSSRQTFLLNAGSKRLGAENGRNQSCNLSLRKDLFCHGIGHLHIQRLTKSCAHQGVRLKTTTAEANNNDTTTTEPKSNDVISAAANTEETITDDKKPKRAKDKVAKSSANLRNKISDFLEQKSGYSWLLGPIVLTAMIVLPSMTMGLANIFQRNYLAGLAATFGLDVLFVLSTDLFLVLTNKLGHHNQVAGGPPPWIGPWEFTGYPEGFPKVLNSISYASVGVAALATLISFFTGKLGAALATLAPYLSLIFVQVAYERLMTGEKLPVAPLVPIVYTVYRFRQLNRALLLAPVLNGGGLLSRFLLISSSLWVLYLAMYLTQLPWLYSTWNTNKAT